MRQPSGMLSLRWRARPARSRRRRHQHRLGEGHAHEVGQRAAPVAAEDPEAVHRARRARSCSRRSDRGGSARTRRTRSGRGRRRGPPARRRAPRRRPRSTSATNSWPMAIGPGIGASPRRIGWSRSHSATASGRTSASPGPWSAGAGTSHHSTWRSAVIVSCCIRPPGVAGAGAAGAQLCAARRHSAARGPARARLERGDRESARRAASRRSKPVASRRSRRGASQLVEAGLHRRADRLAARRHLERGGGHRAPALEVRRLQAGGEQAGERLDGVGDRRLGPQQVTRPPPPGRPRGRSPRPRSAPCRPGSSGTASPRGASLRSSSSFSPVP